MYHDFSQQNEICMSTFITGNKFTLDNDNWILYNWCFRQS